MTRSEQLVSAVHQAQFPYFDSLIHLFVGGSELHGAKLRTVCFDCVWKTVNANPSQAQASARRSRAFAGMGRAGCGLRENACTSLPTTASGGTTSSFRCFLIPTRSVSDQTRWL